MILLNYVQLAKGISRPDRDSSNYRFVLTSAPLLSYLEIFDQKFFKSALNDIFPNFSNAALLPFEIDSDGFNRVRTVRPHIKKCTFFIVAPGRRWYVKKRKQKF